MSADGGPPDYLPPERLDWNAEEDSSLAQVAFLLDPAGILERRWVWMLCAAVLGLAASVVAYHSWRPVFVAQASLLITSQQIPSDFVRSTVQEDTIANIDAMVGEILSTERLGQILDQIDLFPELEDKETRIGLISRLRSATTIAREAGRGGGARSLIYKVAFEHSDPDKAAAASNALAALFVEVSTRRRNQQARQATLFLQRELERDEADLRQQSQRVTQFRQAHRGELPEELDVSLKKLEFISQQRVETLTEISETEARLVALRSGEGLVRSRDEVLLEELRRQLAEQLAVHTDEHPNVTALERRVGLLEEKVAQERQGGRELPAEVRRQVEGEERKLARLRSKLLDLDSERSTISARVDRTPAVAEELTALLQKEEVLREDYLNSLRKVEAAERAESLEASHHAAQVAILDSARPPSAPALEAWVVLLGGIAGTLVLAVGIGVLLELIDPVIVSAAQLDHLSERPVLGAIPRFE